MKTTWLDAATALVLVAAIAVLAWPLPAAPGRVAVPMLLPDDAPGSLHQPGADRTVLAARAAAMGEVLTIEDLIRSIVALEAGQVEGLPPLTEAERAELRDLLALATGHRDALLAVEGQLAAAEDRLDGAAKDMAAELTPQQRGFIQEERDQISVQGVEEAYWKDAEEALK